MKGAVFIALQEMIEQQAGLATWHKILDAAGSDGVFTATLTYDDDILMSLVAEVCTALHLTAEEAQRALGQFLFDFLHKGHPVFADSKTDFFAFIESIGGVIHLEVVKLDEDARPPKIEVQLQPDGSAAMTYYSRRKLCYLAEGLLMGAAQHYGISIHIEHLNCMHDGHEQCDFRIVEHEQS